MCRPNQTAKSMIRLLGVITVLCQAFQCLSTVISATDSILAYQHFSRVIKEAKCQTPVPKVIQISDHMLSAKKKFIPHCTVLHFCGRFSGCCRQENEQCVPKTVEDVKLYFWVIELTADGKQRKGVEHIVMKNHTECHCQPINEDTPR